MHDIEFFSVLITSAAGFSYLNQRYVRLPTPILLMLMGVVLSLALFLAETLSLPFAPIVHAELSSLNFTDFLLGSVLSFLLFAGSMHVPFSGLKSSIKSIASFASLGVFISVLLVATSLYFLLKVSGIEIEYRYCLVFGALISPTDPIAIMGLLKQTGIAESVRLTITGESLFNDGVGVVLFTVLLGVAQPAVGGIVHFDLLQVLALFVRQTIGGLLAGLAIGYAGYYLMKSIDHFQSELLLTLAMVMGGATFCHAIGVSGPLAMVVAGMITGNISRTSAFSEVSRDYIIKFWEMIDEILNAILFMLIGLQLAVIPFTALSVCIGIAMAILLLPIRYISLWLPVTIFRLRRELEPKSLNLMTLGGLRGGISIALALSLPISERSSLFLPITFVIVLISIVLQTAAVQRVAVKDRLGVNQAKVAA